MLAAKDALDGLLLDFSRLPSFPPDCFFIGVLAKDDGFQPLRLDFGELLEEGPEARTGRNRPASSRCRLADNPEFMFQLCS